MTSNGFDPDSFQPSNPFDWEGGAANAAKGRPQAQRSPFGPGGGVPEIDVDALLAGLTPPQRAAVLHKEGPLLVLAAAGSGKTRVITRRIAYLVSAAGGSVKPWQILALTFTNKAAGEMRERVAHLLGGADSRAARGLTVATFHSLCARLLRKYAEHAGLKPDFTIYDTSDQTALMKKVFEAVNMSSANFPPRSVLSAISNAKNELLGPEQFAQRAMDFSQKQIAKAYSAYEAGLHKANAVDFDDLLVKIAKLLKSNAQVRAELQARYTYLLVDEYQDTNHAQFVIASMIAGDGKATADGGKKLGPNFCVVGDPDQSIYGWRGADINNILEFEENYPQARVITLGENFRSHAPILAAADTLIKQNKKRKDKPLFTSKAGGEKIDAILCRDERHEAQLVTEWIRALKQSGLKSPGPDGKSGAEGGKTTKLEYKDFAVFYRMNALSRVMEDALRSAGIPYTIARGTAFFEREEVKTAVSYLKVVANQADGVALERIINTPARGISDTTVETLDRAATMNNATLFEACRRSNECGLQPRAAAAVERFVQLVDGWTGAGTFMGQGITGSLADLVDRIIKESTLEAMYVKQAKQSQSDADESRVENLFELVNSAREFEMEYDPAGDAANALEGGDGAPGESAPATQVPPLLALLRAWLESIALVADSDAIDPESGSVTLMTLHAAKGLEFPAVAMIGLEEGLLPHSRALMSETEMEEERRLCFVGITRAMNRLLLSAAKYRTQRGLSERTIPSRFLSELPSAHLSILDKSDVFEGLNDDWQGGGDDSPREPVYRRDGFSSKGNAAGGTAWKTGGGGVPSMPRAGGGASSGIEAKYPVGCQVRHPQFGLGKVVSVQGGPQARATVEFREVGKKTLVLEYARLTRV